MPSFITASTASGVATPSITVYAASLISGISTRFETKPGASFTATGVFPSFFASSIVVANAASLVCSARITSTSTITGTGFMKCMPTNCYGRFVIAASVVIAIEEVLLVRITSGRSSLSASVSTARLISSFSGTASTTKSAVATAAKSVTGFSRASTCGFSASVNFPFFTSRSRFLPIVSIPRCRKLSCTSRKITLYPARANTCAMPFPIVPAPSTATVLIESKLTQPPSNSQPRVKQTRVGVAGQAAERRAEDLRLLQQNEPRSQGRVLFVLRPGRPEASPELSQSPQEFLSLRPKRLHAAVQQLSVLDARNLHAANCTSVPQRFTEMFSVRGMDQRVRQQYTLQTRQRLPGCQQKRASRQLVSVALQLFLHRANGATRKPLRHRERSHDERASLLQRHSPRRMIRLPEFVNECLYQMNAFAAHNSGYIVFKRNRHERTPSRMHPETNRSLLHRSLRGRV